ncbi:hypothetical protein TVAG_110700 [Trichomonas vaginalis G3]|uniref:Uncharacterized protein n=1 Tax=Trichomonas vaginalis (strain ATCC PRA-98 / G3) TaxID=412133 RepID=A2DGS0_TRIV3|nr:hypothetical protein TVAGG3_0997330 [Trichomonas vaginalis G3]EAY20457.1 hypothetical protein TVAG_110700 [Trichomonas vaginalis G3]KAI5490493.1 hypothetical protein TVAGG3_0997330 [Trichomonas vaginalis G3]|eukprot:XP_001581443.1 hypothetical protein [Trichomonas vaginalis G3]
MYSPEMYFYSFQMPVQHQKTRTPQSIRDYEKVQKRMKDNGSKVDQVSTFIDKYFGTHVTIAILTSLAKIVMGRYALKLDRLARRNRSALLCWYAENWDVIFPLLNDSAFEMKLKSIKRLQNMRPKIEPLAPKPANTEFIDPSDLTLLLNFH